MKLALDEVVGNASAQGRKDNTDHFGRLWASDIEFLIGVLFPVAKEEGELQEEPIVCITKCSDRLGTRVSVESSIHLTCAYELLPVLEAIGVGIL